jgi:DNA-binding response OmpR family regulator
MRVVIVAEPSRLREGLETMLDSFLTLQTVAVVEERAEALNVIRSMQPDLAILDAQLLNESTVDLVRSIKLESSGIRCIVVTERLAQFQPILEAGADEVLLKGFSAAELRSGMEQLLENMTDRSSATG